MDCRKIFSAVLLLSIIFCSSPVFAEESTKILYLKTIEDSRTNLFLANTKNELIQAEKNPEIIELDLNDRNLKINTVFTEVINNLKKENFDIIFSLNFTAVIQIAKHLPDTPVVCSMIPQEDAYFLKLANNKATGVATKSFLHEKFAFLKKLKPETKTIGLIYKPQKYKKPLLNAKIAARENNLELVLIEADKQSTMLAAINKNIKNIDALTMLPGSDLRFPIELIRYISSICTENNKIFIGWEPEYITEGALFCIYPDVFKMSKQCGTIIKRIQDAESPTAIDFQINEEYFLSYNLTVAKQLNIILDAAELDEIDILSE